MRPILRLAVLALLPFALASCLVETEQPLSAEGAQPVDRRLAGRWINPKKPDELELAVVPTASPTHGHLRIVFSEPARDGQPAKAMTMRAWTTEIDGQTYATVDDLKIKDGAAPTRLIVAYDIRPDGSLVIAFMRTEFVRDFILAKRLKGFIRPGSSPASPVITASSAEIATFIRAHGREQAFEKWSDPLVRAPAR